MLLKSPTVLILGRVVGVHLTLVHVVILARELGPEGRGITAAIFAVSAILPSILGLGMPLAAKRSSRSGDADSVLSDVIGALVVTSPIALGVGAVVGYAFSPLVSNIESVLIVFLIALVPVQILGAVIQQVLLARRKYLQSALSMVGQPLGMTLAVLGFVIASRLSVSTALIAQMAGLIFLTTLSLFLVKPRLQRPRPVKLLRVSMGYWGRDVSRGIGDRIDQIIVLPLLGATQAGLYSVAVAVASAPLIIGHAIGQLAFQRSSEAPESSKSLLLSYSRAGVAITFVTALLSAPLLILVFPFLFGREFSDSAAIAVAMLFTILPIRVFLEVATNALNGLGKSLSISVGELVGLLVGSVSATLLSFHWGLWGVLVGFGLGYLSNAVQWGVQLEMSPRAFRPNRRDFSVVGELFPRNREDRAL
jgi:O-antigen/teichoic acid export membrane protein